MGLTEGHFLNDEGGAWEPIGGWFCMKYPRKEYIALLDVMCQAIDDYKEAVDELKNLEARGPQRTKVSENDVAIGEPRPDADDVYSMIVDHYHTVLEKIEQQINFLAWELAEISEVRDNDSE